MTTVEEAKKIVENLSDDATWDDLMYKLYVRTNIERSIKTAEAGNVALHEGVQKNEMAVRHVLRLKKQLS